MAIERIDPPELAPVPGAAHITVATGSRIIHIAGQTGVDATGVAVGDTYAVQAAQALRNLRVAVEAAGATLADIARMTVYVVDYTPEAFDEIVGSALETLGEDYPVTAATLIGVATLWQPDLLIEVEATVVAD